MSDISKPERADSLLASRVRVPDDVVYRSFGRETIVLSLAEGKYHSVNATGGRMLEILDKVGSVRRTAKLLAGEYGRELSEVEEDLSEFCEVLLDRRLLAVEPA
jgi:hypothetical protein